MRYRVGVIGCGLIGPRHLKGFGEHPECEVVAVADLQQERAEARAAEFDVPSVYTDPHELLHRHRPEIVSINTWPGTHAELTLAALEHGAQGILCEKPLGRDLAEVDRMLAACDAAGAKLCVGFQHRYRPAMVTACRLIREGAIGEPTVVWNPSSGGLMNNGSHGIDLMRFLLGDPQALWVFGSVERRTDRHERGEPCEDRCSALIAFEGGARGVVESDMPGSDWPKWYTVHGSEGSLRVSETVEVLGSSGSDWRPAALDDTASQHDEFVAWLKGEAENRTDAHQNRHVTEIQMALYESARRRALVELPLADGASPLVAMIEEGTLAVEEPGKYDIRA